MGKERNYGVDLLRLVLMYMVCMMHTLRQGGILDTCEVGSLHYKTYWLIAILSDCAVNGFAIISGYMAADKPRKYEKLVEMWFQAFFYSFIVTLIFTLIGVNKNWETFDIVKSALPVMFGKFWYFTAFFALFTVVGAVADPFVTQWGYSALWLIVLYMIGVLAKRIKLFETKKSSTLIIMWACSVLLTWSVYMLTGVSKVINYNSPTILLNGMIMVILFSRMKVKGGIISKISPLAFGIYLFQLNQVIWHTVLKDAFAFVAGKNIVVGIGYIFIFASAIFVSGLIVEFIRSKIAKLIRIPDLSKKIVGIIDVLIVKLFVLLK